MSKFFGDIKFRFFLMSIVTIGLVLFTEEISDNSVFAAEEDSVILQAGVISTEKKDYIISNDFEIRVIQEGKLLRISGTTADGFPYYAYQRTSNEDISLYGKVIVNGEFVQIIKNVTLVQSKVQEPVETVEEIPIPSKPEMLVLVQQSDRKEYGYAYTLTAKVFDAKINSNQEFYSSDGKLEGIKVTVTISDSEGNLLTSFDGLTDVYGQYDTSYLWGYNDARGTYTVTLVADNGETTVTQNYETAYLGYIEPKDNP